MNNRFNLVDEPWIPVVGPSGPEVLPLRDLLLRSHELRDLSLTSAQERSALIRFLCAVAGRAVGDRWDEVWESGMIDPARLDSYLGRVRDRFWLFGERPFYQVADLVASKGGKANPKPVDLFMPVRVSEHQVGYRDIGDGETIGFAEAARLLIHLQAYDGGGKKPYDLREVLNGQPSSSPAWMSRIVCVLARGRTLFHTIMLNWIPGQGAGDDVPAWEREQETWRPASRRAEGQFDLFTYQSRRILLVADGERVTHVHLTRGTRFQVRGASGRDVMFTDYRGAEPHTAWVRGKDGGYSPGSVSDATIWAGVGDYLPRTIGRAEDAPRIQPAVVTRVGELLLDEVITPGDPQFLGWTTSAFDYKNGAKVFANPSDGLDVPVALAVRDDLGDMLSGDVAACVDAVRCCSALVSSANKSGAAGESFRSALMADLELHVRGTVAGATEVSTPSHIHAGVAAAFLPTLLDRFAASLNAADPSWWTRKVGDDSSDTGQVCVARILRRVWPVVKGSRDKQGSPHMEEA